VPEIAKLSGLSLADVTSILDRHYLGGDQVLAENAVRKLETRTKLQNGLQNGLKSSTHGTEKA